MRKLFLIAVTILCCRGVSAQGNLFGEELSEEEVRERGGRLVF